MNFAVNSRPHPCPDSLKIYAPACATQLVSRILDKFRSVLSRFPDATTLTVFLCHFVGSARVRLPQAYFRHCSKTRCEHESLSSRAVEEFARAPELR